MIEFLEVTKSYLGMRPILESVSLKIDKGEFFYLTGVTGAGKPTIFKLLLLLAPADSGQLLGDKDEDQREERLITIDDLLGPEPQGPPAVSLDALLGPEPGAVSTRRGRGPTDYVSPRSRTALRERFAPSPEAFELPEDVTPLGAIGRAAIGRPLVPSPEPPALTPPGHPDLLPGLPLQENYDDTVLAIGDENRRKMRIPVHAAPQPAPSDAPAIPFPTRLPKAMAALRSRPRRLVRQIAVSRNRWRKASSSSPSNPARSSRNDSPLPWIAAASSVVGVGCGAVSCCVFFGGVFVCGLSFCVVFWFLS